MEYRLITSSQAHTLQDEINKKTMSLDNWKVLTIFPKAGTMVAVLYRETDDIL